MNFRDNNGAIDKAEFQETLSESGGRTTATPWRPANNDAAGRPTRPVVARWPNSKNAAGRVKRLMASLKTYLELLDDAYLPNPHPPELIRIFGHRGGHGAYQNSHLVGVAVPSVRDCSGEPGGFILLRKPNNGKR